MTGIVAARVLVTGGGGLSRYIVDALGDYGETAVGYGDAYPALGSSAEGGLGQLFDLPRLLRVMREHAVERLVYAPHASDACSSVELPVATVVGNVQAIVHLLEAARLAGVGGRIVLLSSTAVYGDNAQLIDEASPLRPRTPYAVTKVTSEQLAGIYADLYGLDVVILRVGDVYGPELAPSRMLRALLDAAVNGETYRLSAGADQSFHLTHGEDVSRAVRAALAACRPNQRVYNITGGERHSLAQVAELVSIRFPRSRFELGPGRLPELDHQGPLDIRAADRELGYRPLWGLARGLDDYAEWLLARREAA